MANHRCLILTLTAVAAVLLNAATSASRPMTENTADAYSMLQQYGFPPGIMPQGVQSYQLNPADGSFEVHFPGECGLRIGGFKLRYSSRLAGNIQNGSISGLEGVKVKLVVAWVGIREIGRDGGDIKVHAGSITKSFPAGDFSVSPPCQ